MGRKGFVGFVLVGALAVSSCRSQASLDAELLDAAGRGDSVAMERAIKHGANVSAIDPSPYRGFSALALSAQHAPIVAMLIKHGANPNQVDGNGLTPLIYACGGGYLSTIEVLFDAGADLKFRTSSGDSLLDDAASRGQLEIVRYLLDHGLSATAANMNGYTPLHHAVISPFRNEMSPEIVKLLIEHGADRSARDNKGHTAYDFARTRFFKKADGTTRMLDILRPPRLPEDSVKKISPAYMQLRFTIFALNSREIATAVATSPWGFMVEEHTAHGVTSYVVLASGDASIYESDGLRTADRGKHAAEAKALLADAAHSGMFRKTELSHPLPALGRVRLLLLSDRGQFALDGPDYAPGAFGDLVSRTHKLAKTMR